MASDVVDFVNSPLKASPALRSEWGWGENEGKIAKVNIKKYDLHYFKTKELKTGDKQGIFKVHKQ